MSPDRAPKRTAPRSKRLLSRCFSDKAWPMTRAEEYRALAQSLKDKAATCPDLQMAGEYRKLAMGWMMLANQAEQSAASASARSESAED